MKKWLMVILVLCASVLSGCGGVAKANKLYVPTVLLTFDDGHHGVYDTAMPIMDKYGFKGTAYVVSDWVGDTKTFKMTWPQLDELYSKGWAIANHTKDHTDLTKLTEQGVIDELTTCENALLTRGYTRSARHVAYPYGDVNETVLSAMSKTGMLTGRTLNADKQATSLTEFKLITPSLYVLDNTTLETAESALNNAISNKRPCVVVFHKIVPSLTGNEDQWTTTNFKAFIDYIASKNIRAITIDEYYDELKGVN